MEYFLGSDPKKTSYYRNNKCNNFKQFLDYVMSFYGDDDALYPIDNLTREEVALATLNYLDLVAASNGTINWGDGDSLDQRKSQRVYY